MHPSPPRLHSTEDTGDMHPLSPQAPRIQVSNAVDGFVIIQSLDLAWLNKI